MRKLSILSGVFLALVSFADTTFVNLSDKGVRIARYWYTDGNSGDYDEQGWVFKGWSVVNPGEVFESSSDHFYLEQRDNNRALTWNGLPKSSGFIKRGGPFEVFWPKGASTRRMTDRGYVPVSFMTFEDQLYKINGDKYRLSEKNIPFSFESRSLKFINESFEVPGRVVSADIEGEERGGKNLKWTTRERALHLSGSIEGRQTSPFASREKGYYRGSIHVKYVAPR